MEAMNRAIEDASDFMEMKRKLMERNEQLIVARERGAQEMQEMLDDMGKLEIAPKADQRQQPKRPGENREQYRARIFGKKTADHTMKVEQS